MQWTDRIRQVKIFLVVAAILIAVASLLVSRSLTHDFLSKVIRKKYQVVIAAGSHLFPFRTEKLSPFAPMVLQYNAGE